MSKTLVYFIKPKGRKGPIKIGCSNVPETRLSALSAWSPYRLEIIGTVPGDYPDEAFIHRCLAADHSHREWFKATPLVVTTISKIIEAGNVNVIRGVLSPVGNIRTPRQGKRTDIQKLHFSYDRRISNAGQRIREAAEAWYSPPDVRSILGFMRTRLPTDKERARLDEYLAAPETHGVIPPWKERKVSICVPISSVEEIAA